MEYIKKFGFWVGAAILFIGINLFDNSSFLPLVFGLIGAGLIVLSLLERK